MRTVSETTTTSATLPPTTIPVRQSQYMVTQEAKSSQQGHADSGCNAYSDKNSPMKAPSGRPTIEEPDLGGVGGGVEEASAELACGKPATCTCPALTAFTEANAVAGSGKATTAKEKEELSHSG